MFSCSRQDPPVGLQITPGSCIQPIPLFKYLLFLYILGFNLVAVATHVPWGWQVG